MGRRQGQPTGRQPAHQKRRLPKVDSRLYSANGREAPRGFLVRTDATSANAPANRTTEAHACLLRVNARQTTSATTARPGDHRRAVSATTRDDPALSNAFRAADGARPRHPAAGVFGRVARAHARPAAHTPARQPAAASLPAAGCARPGGPRVRAASGHPRGRWLRQGPLLRGPRRGPSRPQRARHRDPRPFGGAAWSKRWLGLGLGLGLGSGSGLGFDHAPPPKGHGSRCRAR